MMRFHRRSFLAQAAAVFAAASAGGAGSALSRQISSPTTHVIRITGFRFEPSEVAVQPGDSIVWINEDIAPHTATASDGRWDTGKIARNETRMIVATDNVPGEYHCRFHPEMRGHIVPQ